MKKRVGIFAERLTDKCPRGVHRVARAITERLVESDEFEFYCLGLRYQNQYEITYEAFPLSAWLAQNPLINNHVIFDPTDLIRLTLNDLNFIICFDQYIGEPQGIWDLPVENYPVKLIFWFHDAIPIRINEGKNWTLDRFYSAVSKAVLKSDVIVCISHSTENDLTTFFPYSRGKTRVIYIGHDIERFSIQKKSHIYQKVIDKFGIDNKLPYALFIGTVERRKNIVNILRACLNLCLTSSNIRFQLVLAGNQEGYQDVSWLIEKVKTFMPVICTGYIEDEDAVCLLQRASLFLFPSLWEGFGIPLLEAMTSNTLVVTSDISSLPEVGSQHALYCDPYDPNDMAATIKKGIEMPEDLKQTRTAQGREYAARFTWEKSATELLDLLHGL